MRRAAVSTMVTNLVRMVGVDSFLTAESTAAVRRFNRFLKLAWDRTAWPFVTRVSLFIQNEVVRSVELANGEAGYTSALYVALTG